MKSIDRIHSLGAAALAAFVFCVAPSPGAAGQTAHGPALELPAPGKSAWPTAIPRQGSYFSFAVPDGWRVTETPNAVDITNPDGAENISFGGLEGTPGTSSPKRQVEKIGQAIGARNLRILQTVRRPFQHGFDTAQYVYSFTASRGQQCEGWAWCSVNNSLGRNNSYVHIAFATIDRWRQNAQFLAATARVISVINPRQAFMRDQLIRLNIPVGPGSAGGFNHPNTFTPYSNQAAMDRISDRNARVRRDDYPLVDPSTGRTYHGNTYNFDYVRGGWVNPNDHTRLLQVVPPGR